MSCFQKEIKDRFVLKIEREIKKQEGTVSFKGFDNLMYLLLTSAFEKQYRRATTKPWDREGRERQNIWI